MSNIEELNAYLEQKGLAIRGVSVHPGQEATAEQVAGEILRTLKVAETEYPSESSWEEFVWCEELMQRKDL